MKVDTKIPIAFEKVKDYDNRFQKVKIWLMHLGKNYNRSIFDKDVVVNAMDSLKNTPILGYISQNKLGDKDFRGHEVELIVENGQLKEKYLGMAFGVIPENCNPRFEFKEGDSGDLLEYLVVDGLLWTKFDDAISILEGNDGSVPQSMELSDNYDGYWDEDGWFHFTKFSFYGACMLGQDVLPAMQKASVELAFSASVIQDEINKKLEEFNQILAKYQSKEVEHQVTIDEILAKYEISIEQLSEKGINVDEYSVEELELKIKEMFSSNEIQDESQVSTNMEENQDTDSDSNSNDEDEDGQVNDDFSSEDGNSDNQEQNHQIHETFTLKFELSHDDIRAKMYENLDTHISMNGFQDDWHYIVSIYETYLIAENSWGEKFYKIGYSKEGDNIILGKVEEVFPMFLTAEEKGALEMIRSNYQKLEQEVESLKAFQSDVLKQQHESKAEELFASFSKLDENDLADLRANVHNYTIEELESKCFEILGRKMATFQKKEKQSNIHIKFSQSLESNVASTIDKIFEKHGFKKN